MVEKGDAKLKISWGFILLGAACLFLSFIMIFQGIEANKSDIIIPATRKSGPMTGLQSIFIGFLAGIAGIAFLGYEVFKKKRRSRNRNEIVVHRND
jgi:uncharacterized membrane protein YfcA